MPRISASAALVAACLIAPSAASAAASYNSKVLGESTIAGQWRLGDTSGTRAAAAKGPSGVYRNGPKLGQMSLIAGDTNKSVFFDGVNDYVAVPDQAALRLKRFTLEAWVDPSWLSSRSKTVIAKQGSYWLSITPQNQFRLGFSSASGTKAATAAGTVQTARPYHVYGTYDGATLRLCVNGVEKAAVKATGNPASSSSPLRIGAMTAAGAEGFRGLIDEPAVYNAAGSCDVAKAHYDEGIAVAAPANRGGGSTLPTPIPNPAPIPNPLPNPNPAPNPNPSPNPNPNPNPNPSPSPNPAPARPAPPTGLKATAGNGRVTLDWNDSQDLVSGDRYQVYQDGALIADGPTSSNYTVSGLTNGRQYSFRVSAGGSSSRPADQRYGDWTAEAYATPQGAPSPGPTPPDVNSSPGQNASTVFPGSYFYNRVPANPNVDAHSSNWVDRYVSDGKPQALYLNDWMYPQYEASPSDPVYTVKTLNYVGPQGDGTVRIPAGAVPAAGGDGNMGITDRAKNSYWGFYGVESIDRSAHTITARGSGTTALDGNGSLYGESSLKVATKLGIVTPEELDAGHIDHALMVVAYCTTGVTNGSGDTRQCSSVGKPSSLPNGAHLQLQISDAELAAFPAWKRTILRAMRDYGVYVAETGGGFMYADYAAGSDLATKWQNWLNAHSSDGGINASGRTLDVVSGIDWRSRLRVVSP